MSRSCVLVFGEDATDTGAIRVLIRSLLPEHDVELRREPIILSRNAHRHKRGTVAERISAFARAEEARRPRVIVVAHRDCDALEPAHEVEGTELERELSAAGVRHPVAACPAWEVETWWMAFPEAIAAVRRCWRAVNYANRDLGKITGAKERLIRDLRPLGALAKRCPDYTESDSVRVAEEIVRLQLLTSRLTKSASLNRFYAKLMEAAA